MADTDIEINKLIFNRIDRKKKDIDSKRPLSKTALKRLNEEVRLLHTYHSNAIEGSTLTLQETKLVIEDGITVGGKSLKEHLEAAGTAKAFDSLEAIVIGNKGIDSLLILELHEIAAKGWLEDAGRYRTQNVKILGAIKTPPDFTKVPELMKEMIKGLKKMKGHPVVKSAFLHHRFVEIHPFSNGNGRVARLLTNLFLMKQGFPPIILKKENRASYYKHLKNADSGHLGPFANFIAKAVDEALSVYLAIFGGKNQLISLSELAKVTPYSQEYLSLRARQGVLDAVKIGRVWHSSKAAMEDYIKRYADK